MRIITFESCIILLSMLCTTIVSQSGSGPPTNEEVGSGSETEKNKCDLNEKNKCNCECKNIYKTYSKKRKDIQLQSCEPQQSDQSNCTLSCSNGFTGNNVTYLCNVTTNDNCVLIGSQEILCERVECPPLTNGMIECLNESTIGVFGDTCTFSCNDGFELQGSNLEECLADGSWSGGNVTCIPVYSADHKDNHEIHRIIAPIVPTVLIIIIVVLCFVIWCRRCRRKRKIYHVYTRVNEDSISHTPDVIYDTIGAPYVQYEQAYCETPLSHKNSNSHLSKVIYETVSKMEPMYDCDTNVIHGYPVTEEEEQKIYDMPPDEEDQYYGHIYANPPAEEEEIYEAFKGKNVNILYHKDVRVLECLGSGEFGVVSHGLLHDKLEVAVKTLNDDSTDKDRLRFLQEAAIMCQFDHENVVKFYGVVTDAPITIVLEYMPHGDLRQFLIELRPLADEAVGQKLPFFLLKFCQEVAAGIAYLNSIRFIHRDLAARNILVSESYTCKIADFGMSRDVVNSIYYITSGKKIPIKWTAPEALNYKKYSLFSDVWSYGCVLYEIWSLGCKPFEDFDNHEVPKMIDEGYRLPPPPGCPRIIYRMMIKCWNPDPRSRPQFGQINSMLAKDGRHLLAWSDEDQQAAGEDGMKLGSPLQSGTNIYPDLQCMYK